MPAFSVLGGQKQRVSMFKVSLGYIESMRLFLAIYQDPANKTKQIMKTHTDKQNPQLELLHYHQNTRIQSPGGAFNQY